MAYALYMLRNVAAVLVNGFLPFEFGTICEVFGVDRSDDGLPCYDFAVVGGEPSPLRTLDFTVQASYGLERLEEADLIALPAVSDERLAAARRPGRRRAEVSRGAARGPASRRVPRHAGAEHLQRGVHLGGGGPARRPPLHHPLAATRPTWPAATRTAKVDPDVLYVDDDPVITSAGTAAGIDACLYLVRKEQGTRVANGIARRMVVPPHRDGGQAQYVGAAGRAVLRRLDAGPARVAGRPPG